MERVQRKRTKGYKLPPNTKCVDRSTKWGNPYTVAQDGDHWGVFADYPLRHGKTLVAPYQESREQAHAIACVMFEAWLWEELSDFPEYLEELREYDRLACWCAEELPCHVDVYIRVLGQWYPYADGR